MNAADLRDCCLSFSGVEETFPFGELTSVFKVEGKMFALSALGSEPLRVSVKCEPALAERLREAHPEITPGYHLNKRHWNTVLLDGTVPADELVELIDHSYDLVVSRLTKAARDALVMTAVTHDRPAPDAAR